MMPALWDNPHYRAERDRRQFAALELPTWRTGLYWCRLVDPTHEEQAAQPGAMWSLCRRCGVRENVLLPADLGDVVSRLREIATRHVRCPQTLVGARWELLVTLRLRGEAVAQ